MARKPATEVDEELVRQMIAGQIPLATKVSKPTSEDSDTKNTAIEPVSEENRGETDQNGITATTAYRDSRRKRNKMIPDYERTFLVPTDYGIRASLYVSASTKRKILGILKRIGGDRLTATSFVDNILRHHIEVFRDEINRLDRARNSEDLV